MLLYLYALADDLADVDGLSGLEDEPVALIPAGDILAVAGWIGEVPAVERDNLIAQDRLVRELHRPLGRIAADALRHLQATCQRRGSRRRGAGA